MLYLKKAGETHSALAVLDSLQAQGSEDHIGGTRVGCHILMANGSTYLTQTVILHQSVHDSIEESGTRNLKASTHTQKVLSLTESLIVGAYENRHTVYGCLRNIVDTHTKAATHIGNMPISVYTAQESVTIDYQTISICHRIHLSIGVAHTGALDFLLNLTDTVITYHMRHQNQFQARMLIEIRNNQ